MLHEIISFQSSFNCGPSLDREIEAPVWVTQTTLDSRPVELEHVLSRYQLDIHLGDAMPVEFHQNDKKLTRVVHFGDLTWTPAGDSCRATWGRARDVGFVSLSRAFLEQTADEVDAARLPNYAIFSYGDPLMRELVLALVRHGSSDHLYAETLANSLIAHLLKSFNEKHAQSAMRGKLTRAQLQRAVDYLEDRLGGKLSLQPWAREVGLSSFHFARLFKQTTGLAPHQFALRRRIDRAKSILAASDASLSTVAYDLGFANQSHFNRAFRQYTGTTPGEWRGSISS